MKKAGTVLIIVSILIPVVTGFSLTIYKNYRLSQITTKSESIKFRADGSVEISKSMERPTDDAVIILVETMTVFIYSLAISLVFFYLGLL